MNRATTDQEHQTIIAVYFDQIEIAVQTARIHMDSGADGSPETVDRMFEFIGKLAKRGQQFKWPNPAKLVQDARQDPALQQLLKRASKPTPIRAGRAPKGVK